MPPAAPADSSPLRIRRRPDVEVSRRQVRGLSHFVLKDPVSLRYHQLNNEEFFLWRRLDGERSAEELCEAFEGHFLERRLSPLQLEQFVGQLHRDALVVADATGQGETLLERGRRSGRRAALSRLANPLALRFRGVDPRWLLDRLGGVARHVFSPTAAVATALFVAGVCLLAAANFHEFQARILETSGWTASLLPAAVALALLKCVHELGHALLCRRFDRECHEIGVMVLVFTPCLYCDVSDSWMLPSKWRRAAVAAAGIWVELTMAAAAGLLWWFSEPGLFHAVCFHMMAIGSLNSLLLNGNPLLRFDGYYVLSDLAELPNLGPRSQQVLEDAVRKTLLGIEPLEQVERGAERRWLLLYGALSLVYRVLLVSAILAGVYFLLQPHRLQSVAVALGAVVLAAPATRLLRGLRKLTMDPSTREPIRSRRLAWTVAVLAGLLSAAVWVPVPRIVRGRAVLRFNGERSVRVKVEGLLVESVREGQAVNKGDRIALLENDELQRRLVELQEQQIQLKLRIDELQALRRQDPEAVASIPTVQQQLAGVLEELASRRAEVARLDLRAPRSGMVVAPPPREPAPDDPLQLPGWDRTPLDPQNRGCLLTADTLLCSLGLPEDLVVIVRVAPAQIDAVAEGQSVRVRLASWQRSLSGNVTGVSRVDPRDNPDLAHFLADEDDSQPFYSVLVRLDEPVTAPIGSVGAARIEVASLPLATRLRRWAARTFRLRM